MKLGKQGCTAKRKPYVIPKVKVHTQEICDVIATSGCYGDITPGCEPTDVKP